MRFQSLPKGLFLLFLILVVSPTIKAQSSAQETKVLLRAIGHKFLLQLNDSTSRVLPIEKIGKRYVISFENEFSFDPDLLFFATYSLLEETSSEDSYIVEVEKCNDTTVIHSFKASLIPSDDLLACGLRTLPKDCYRFYFTLVNDRPLNLKQEVVMTNYLPWIIVLGLLLIGGFIYLKTRKKDLPKQEAEFITIGQFQFNQKSMTLNLKAQSIELSSKEADLLSLLVTNENETLKREYILKVVWGDDGDYVGRTLDVFISKLRKKLEADASLKIVNIRGVGYRFFIDSRQ